MMALQAVLALMAGGLVGIVFGAMGGGGSLIAIPLFVYVVDIPVQQATVMSLVVVGYSALFGAWREYRFDNVRGLPALLFSLTGGPGAWIGAQGHRIVPEETILFLFGLLMLGIGLWMFLRGARDGVEPGATGCAQQFSVRCMGKALSVGFGVGVMTGFFGIGGGFIIVPTLVLIMGFPFRMAVGTSFLIMVLMSLGGLMGHLVKEQIDWLLTAWILGGSLVGMVAGRAISEGIDQRPLSRGFALLAGGIGVMLMVKNGGVWW